MSRCRGFTLLELLIGMVLLGFILALLFASFTLASNSWDAVENRVERTTEEQMARALVRRLVTQLQPMHWKKGVNQPLTFVGEHNRLQAVAPLAAQSGAAGLRVIELGSAADNEHPEQSSAASQRLILRHGPLRYDAEQFSDSIADTTELTLLSDLLAIEFSYFGPVRRGEPSRWQEAWTNPDQLPQLVRIHLASRQPGWSDVIVAPMIGGTGCRWDNFQKRCR
jgi:general secretion pathway protein J